MRIRDDVLQVRDDMGTSGTKIYNLDYSDPITEIDLLFEAKNGATYNKEAPLERCISKIEIVDGSDVIWSLPGDVALGLWEQLMGRPAHCYRTEGANEDTYQSIPIQFGRYMYDPELAFNPKAFRNPQLKITFDEATVRVAGATGYVSDSWNISIQCKLMEDAPSPLGYLMAKDIYDFTSLASGDERIDMPTDHPYRLLVVRAYKSGTDLRSSLNNYELNCDGGRFICFDKHVRYVVNKMTEYFDPVRHDVTAIVSNASNTQHWIGIDLQGSITPNGPSTIIGASTFWPGLVRAYCCTHAGVAVDNVVGRIVVAGWCPHNCLIIPFGRLDEMSEWFNAQTYNSVKFYLTQNNAGAEVNVCVQQLRKY